MQRIVKSIKSSEPIQGCKRQVRIENVWLLYNFENLKDWFWTRKAAVQYAIYESHGDSYAVTKQTIPDYYQILRGTIIVEIVDKESSV